MKKTKLLLAFILICQTLSAQTVVVIGTGTATQKQPFGMYYGYERSAAIYTTNLVTSSLITSLGWYVGTGKALNSPVKIYIKTTSSSTLSTTTWTAMKTGATLVYSGMLSFPSSGLQIIDIADYVLIGTKIIVMCETNFGGIGASTYPTFRYTNSTNAHEIWQGDDLATVNASTGTLSANRPNIQVTYVAAGSPIPPSGFMASASSSSQINLNWIRNTIPDNVMVAFNTTNTFGTPSGTYVAGNSITGGGTVIYNGSATTYSHNSGLSPATIYHYKAWSVNGGTPIYSVGTSASSATLCNSNTIYPFLTDFESTLFPPICWSYAGLSWARSSSASGYGTGNGSAMANFFTQVSGSFDLISPEINISALTDPIVKFDHAYATYNTQTDKLELWYSIDNGITFMLLTTYLGGISGPLNTGGTSTVAFVPTAGQWATKSYALPAGTNRVMFRGVSLNGNNLYLDNITFLGTCTGVLIPTAVITPGGPTTFCQGGSVALTASGGTYYLWSNAATTSAISVTTSGTYTVTVTNSSGCTDTESTVITVNSLPTAVITPDGPTTFCQGGSVLLTSSGGTGYLWSNSATTAAINVNTSGTYTVTATNSSGCADTENIAITVNSLPTAVITPDGPTTFCQGGAVLLTASGGSGYIWSTTATTSIISVTTSGTYTVTVTNSSGCMDMKSTVITVNSLPTAVITPDGPTTFCQGGSVMLTASGGSGYLWSNSATAAAINVNSSGTYTVTVTNSSGCTDSESTVITVNSLPTAVITPDGPTTFCQGGAVLLTASGGSGYVWSTTATTSTISVTTSGTYTVTVTNSSGCTDTESTVITVNSLPTAVITPDGPTTFCQGGSVLLTASGGTSYLWSTAATTSTISVTTSGTYTVTVTNSSGCTDTESIAITVNSLPIAVITPGGPTTFCQGGSVLLTASGGSGYIWSTTATTSTISITTSGTYTVTVTNSSGCMDTESIAITVNSLPTAVIIPDGPTTFCQGGSVLLTASGGSGYIWSTTATTSAISVTTSGTYTVTVTISSGCKDTESTIITVNSLPTAVITPDGPTIFCQGGSVMLTASGGSGYLWSTSATSAAINVNSSGNYTVTVTSSSGCEDSASTAITVNSLPIAVITPVGPTTFCQGGSVLLTASGGSGYVWSTAATTSTISVTTNGTYTVTVTNSTGCMYMESTVVTVNPLPTVIITPDGPTTFCQGGSVVLTASGGTSYLWSTAATTSTISITTSGTYAVTVTNSSGCTDTESIAITVNSLPTAVITPDGPTTFCQGGSVALTASGGTGYLWSNSVTTAAINVNTSGTYTVTTTNSSGCADIENIAITVNSFPTAVIIPDGPTTFCQGGSVVLTASGGTSYLWSTAATTSTISITTSGTYTVTVTNSSGCMDAESIAITVNSLPTAVIIPDGPTTFCQGGSVLLTASGGTSYLWSNAATTSAISVTTSGTYAVTVTNSSGCTDTESTVVTVNPLPIAIITPDGPTTFCQGGSVLLTASGGSGYLWSNSATTAAININSSRTYAVTVTNSSGCTDTESIAITVNSLPTAVITPDGPTTFCQGGSVALAASGGSNYLWSNSATSAAINVNSSGIYTVTVTNSTGCMDMESTVITVNSLPIAVITPGGPTTFCQGGSVVLTASGGSGYLWSNSATTNTIIVNSGGTFSVCVANEYGCLDTQNLIVSVLPSQPVSVSILPSNNPVPIGTLVTFSTTSTNEGTLPTYQWLVNGLTITDSIYQSISFIPVNGDEISCILTSNAACAVNNPANSNTLIMSVFGVPVNSTVSGIVESGQSECYNASQTLTVAGNSTSFVVYNTGQVNLIAGQNIRMLPGTKIYPGAYLHGFISLNNQYCATPVPSLPNPVTIINNFPSDREPSLFTIFPNPSSGNFNIMNRNYIFSEVVTVVVFNMKGEKVLQKYFSGNDLKEFRMADFPDGCYFLKVSSGNNIQSIKLIKLTE